ncbi:MAG TPA: winged helix DNA-binding domain-containing protein [Flavobacterium sp.]|jgi:hypothetical protein
MTSKQIAQTRLQTQLLLQHTFTDVAQVVKHFGAMQAQDFAMAKWAIAVRLQCANDAAVELTLDQNHIVRTHVLRPTWHFVAAADIHWMLELSAPNIRRQSGSTNRQLGLDSVIFRKSNDIICKALEGGNHFTREELMAVLAQNGIPTDGLRSSHIMFEAELEGLVCNGIRKGKQQTYSLLDEKVANKIKYSKYEAIAELAKRYFTSHGPATIKDFGWWSGLSLADAKKGAVMNQDILECITSDSQQYYLPKELVLDYGESVHLLPAFDEFLISHKDRSASIHPDFANHAFTKNGIFRPIIVVDGIVAGVWKRLVGKDKVTIETVFFEKVSKRVLNQIKEATHQYATFVGAKSVVLL